MKIISKSDSNETMLSVIEHRICQKLIGCIYLGNDEFPRSYLVAMTEIPNYKIGVLKGNEVQMINSEYVIFGELIGRISPSFLNDIKHFLSENYIDKVLCISSNDELRNRVRKACQFKAVWIDNKKRDDSSVILQDWFKRTTREGKPVLTIRDNCIEAKSFNYMPTRLAITYLLEYFDRKHGAKLFKPKANKTRSGYS